MDGFRTTIGTNEIVVRILDELAAHTDNEHGLSVAELSRRVGATEKTVRGHLTTLQTLRPLGRYIGCLRRADLEHAESPDACTGWYMEPAIDAAQLRLMGDGLTLSRIDEEYAADAYRTLRGLAGYAGEHASQLLDMNTPSRYNREFLSNVENLDKAIGERRVIIFNMCWYDMTGELTVRTDAETGRTKEYRADPYQMTYKNGKYYLVCHMHGRGNLSYLHVDRIRNLRLAPGSAPFERQLNDFSAVPGEPFDLAEHMAERPYPWTGPAEDIRFLLTDMLDAVFDWFQHPRIRRVDEHTFDVTVHANATSTLWWALQYADTGNIEILEPQSLRDELARVGRDLVQRYS